MHFKQIPIYIISYNRFAMLKQLVDYLENNGYTNIHIIDNKSDYEPLKEYLKNLKHKVHYMDKNYGHKVFWECGQFDDIIENKYYVVTDPDILPINDCPENFIEIFYNILKFNPQFTKVGFSLKIDDIPNNYQHKNKVLLWEKHFYENEQKFNDIPVYIADIDTTFALYRPNKSVNNKFYKAVRTGFPYQARHLDWYITEEKQTDDAIYYKNTVGVSSTWNNEEGHKLYTDFRLKYSFIEKIFSIKNGCFNYKEYKILTILGFYFRFPRKKSTENIKILSSDFQKPKISVLLPIYNTPEKFLTATINSILNQTFNDFELLILNDSPNNKDLKRIVNSFQDPRIKYFENEKNMGIPYTRNKLIELSQGEYLAVHDHDDISRPTRFEKQVKFLDEHKFVGVVGANFCYTNKRKITKYPLDNKNIKINLFKGCYIAHPVSMIRKKVLTENNVKYRNDCTPAEDYMLWAELFDKTQFANLNDVLLDYNFDSCLTLCIDKHYSDNQLVLTSQIAITLSRMFNNHKEYFLSFDNVIVYYDNGQYQLTNILAAVLSPFFGNNFEYRQPFF